MTLERIGSRTVYEGRVATLRVEEFRYADGSESEREVVDHPGAVVIAACDADSIWMVRQPREAVGEEALLELPAGKLDVAGESPLECAKRELGEEVGKAAREWRELKAFYTSPGILAERMTAFLATGLSDVEPRAGERIEIVRWPVDDLDGAIDACADAKSLVGLILLREALAADERA
jgi:8-oxo-dGTP pyrophosphatase MutT (NUDIX family)